MAGLERQARPAHGPVKERKNGVRQPLQNRETSTTCYAPQEKLPRWKSAARAGSWPVDIAWASCAAEIAAIRQLYTHLLFAARQEVCFARRQAMIRRLRREQTDALDAARSQTRKCNVAAQHMKIAVRYVREEKSSASLG